MSSALLLRLEFQALQDAYVAALDNDRLEDWPQFFTDDCLYEIVPKENEDHGFPAPVIHCTNQKMLRDRVLSLRHANIYGVVVYRHFTSGLTLETAADGSLLARSNYLVVNTNDTGSSTVYQAGIYLDHAVRVGGELRFAKKRVIYDTSRVQTLLAIPI
jgi:anthranilate 1,2-dioxygenase small subunit